MINKTANQSNEEREMIQLLLLVTYIEYDQDHDTDAEWRVSFIRIVRHLQHIIHSVSINQSINQSINHISPYAVRKSEPHKTKHDRIFTGHHTACFHIGPYIKPECQPDTGPIRKQPCDNLFITMHLTFTGSQCFNYYIGNNTMTMWM